MRSGWKGIATVLFRDFTFNSFKTEKAFIVNRSTPITPYFVHSGKTVLVSNGQTLVSFNSKGDGISDKFGSFIFTKSTGMKIHIVKKKNSKK